MKMKRCVCLLLAAIAMLSCLTVGISAAGISRASGSFNITIKAGRTGKSSTLLPLEAGEKVTIKASYTPFSARVDVGLIDENGLFHYVTVEDGSIDETIVVPSRGNYTFAVRNKSNTEISVTGYIEY